MIYSWRYGKACLWNSLGLMPFGMVTGFSSWADFGDLWNSTNECVCFSPVLCHQCIHIKSLISHNDKSNVHPFCSCIFAPDIVTSVFFPSLFLSLKNPLCFDPLCRVFVFYLIIFHCGRGGNAGISWLSPRDSRQRGSAGQGAGGGRARRPLGSPWAPGLLLCVHASCVFRLIWWLSFLFYNKCSWIYTLDRFSCTA